MVTGPFAVFVASAVLIFAVFGWVAAKGRSPIATAGCPFTR